ncbi:DUF1761 domain-containing protein [Patescibacteria group bacterium]|nr:DUF1761 domain-containing protein [Patescibacteria group bacterium]
MEIIINYWAVLGAAVAAIILGALWYGPLFGKQWMGMIGLTPEGMKAMKLSPAMAMGLGLITTLLMAYVLAHGIVFGNAYLGTTGVAGGMMGAFWYWLGFAVPLTAGAYLWEGKSITLWVLNASYYLVSLLLMGAILGYFG